MEIEPGIFNFDADEIVPTADPGIRTSSVAFEEAPPAPPSKAAIKGLQTAINRFYGTAFGSPISVDGAVGNETLAAVNEIIRWLPTATDPHTGAPAPFDPRPVFELIGTRPSVATITLQAVKLSDLLDWIARLNDFTDGLVASPPSVPATKTSAGRRPAAPLPRGPSQKAATTILGLGLPDWAVYGGGAALVLAVAMLIKNKKKANASSTVAVAGRHYR